MTEVITIALAGEPKTGKSHFSLTMPEPIVVFNFDRKLRSVLKKFPDKKIVIHRLQMDIWGKENVTPLRDEFLTLYKAAMKDPEVTTIVIDTATQLWEIIRLAHFEKVTKENKGRRKLMPVEYAEPNSQMRSIIMAGEANGKNLVLTHYTKEIWDSEGNRTSKVEMDGFKQTSGEADLILHFETIPRKDKGRPVDGEDTIVTIVKSGDDRDVVNHKFTNPDWNTLATILEL